MKIKNSKLTPKKIRHRNLLEWYEAVAIGIFTNSTIATIMNGSAPNTKLVWVMILRGVPVASLSVCKAITVTSAMTRPTVAANISSAQAKASKV